MADMAGWAGQRSSVVASAVETLAELVERVSGWEQCRQGPRRSSEGASGAPSASVADTDASPVALANGQGEHSGGDWEEASGAGGNAPEPEDKEAGAGEGEKGEDLSEDGDFGDFGDFEGPPAAGPSAQGLPGASPATAEGGAGGSGTGDAGLEGAWSVACQGWSGNTAVLGAAMGALAEITPLVASPGGDYFGVQLSESATARSLHAFHVLLSSASPKVPPLNTRSLGRCSTRGVFCRQQVTRL